jgi:hypothetical protein
VALFGGQFAGVASEGIPSISASGPNCVTTLAQQLLAAGFDPERKLTLHCAGKPVSETTIREASNQGQTNEHV